jgi:hypothetical protein
MASGRKPLGGADCSLITTRLTRKTRRLVRNKSLHTAVSGRTDTAIYSEQDESLVLVIVTQEIMEDTVEWKKERTSVHS